MSPFLFRTDMPVDSAAGLFIVGAGNTTMPDDARASNPVLGLLLVLAGSCAFSLKNVLVERLFQSDEQPLSVLETTGWQGVFSFAVSAPVLLCMYFIPGSATCGADRRPCMADSLTALRQLAISPQVSGAFVARG